jgi:hypothetical protein
MKNLHIYSATMMDTGVIGCVLQQSSSFNSENFQCQDRFLKNPYVDPWDNHQMDKSHWSHKAIECQEDLSKSYTDWLYILNQQKSNWCWGLSYGGWPKDHPWDVENSNLNMLYLEPCNRTFDMWFKCYMERPITEIKRSFDMHIHDHHQDNLDYKKYMYEKFMMPYIHMYYPKGIPFWVLQSCFHHEGNDIITDPESQVQKFKDSIRDDTMLGNSYSECNANNENFYVTNLFNIDIKDTCAKLDIEYNDQMFVEYQKFIEYVNNVLQV